MRNEEKQLQKLTKYFRTKKEKFNSFFRKNQKPMKIRLWFEKSKVSEKIQRNSSKKCFFFKKKIRKNPKMRIEKVRDCHCSKNKFENYHVQQV